MRGSPGLYRRPSGIYAGRISVPTRLRPTVGKSEIHVSTSLWDLKATKTAALRILIGWREHFMTLDFMTLDAKNLAAAKPLLHGSGLVPVEEAARLLGVSVAFLLTELLNNDATITTYAREWRCWYVDSLAVLAPESDPVGHFKIPHLWPPKFPQAGP